MTNTETRLLFVHGLSPIHVGTGQSLGAVDLAITRDRATGMPLLPGSGIKGALRAKAQSQGRKDVVAVFGPETANAAEHAGSALVGDANLLFLPVRSVAGTYAWVTSPHLLRRFKRDADELGKKCSLPTEFQVPADIKSCRVGKTSSLIVPKMGNTGPRVILEDLAFAPDPADADKLAEAFGTLVFGSQQKDWIDLMKRRFCLVHDDVMSFLAQHATEITTRIRIEADTKTVADGALWTEESLPTETILVSLVMATPAERAKMTAAEVMKALDAITAGSTQLGGKATVGRGRCALRLVKEVA
jgi:CRISPR-associated protein Cmr4